MGTNERFRRVIKRQAITLIVVVLTLIVGGHWYLRHSEISELSTGTLVNVDGKRTPQLFFEIANTPGKRSQGLMWRKELGADRGMLFISPEEKIQTFWMKNTYIPLDMLFIDRNFKVVGILENVPRLNEERRSVSQPSTYVLELNAGAAKKFGIEVGSRLEIQGSLPAYKGG